MLKELYNNVSNRFKNFGKQFDDTYQAVRSAVQSSQQRAHTDLSSRFASFRQAPQTVQRVESLQRPPKQTYKPLFKILPPAEAFKNFQQGITNPQFSTAHPRIDTSAITKKFQEWSTNTSNGLERAGFQGYDPRESFLNRKKKDASNAMNIFDMITSRPLGGAIKASNESIRGTYEAPNIGKDFQFTNARGQQTSMNVGDLIHPGIVGAYRGITNKEQSLFNEVPTALGVNPNTPAGMAIGLIAEIANPSPGGELKMAGKGLSKVDDAGKLLLKGEELTRAKFLINGANPEQMQAMRRAGMTVKEAAVASYPKYKQVLSGVKTIADEASKPVFDDLFAKWIGNREAAKTIGLQWGAKLRDIPEADGMQIINYLEDPSVKVAPELQDQATRIKGALDTLYKKANDAGIDIGYVNRYITHIWEQSPEEVHKALGMKYGSRKIPTYAEGISYGLKPKFTNPSQIVASYAGRLQQLMANMDFFTALKKEGLVVDSVEGVKKGWQPINAQGFPTSKVKTPDGMVQGSYYAAPEVAGLINRVFSPAPDTTIGKVAGFLAGTSGKLQNLALSGGLPKTPLNAFSIMAGVQKEWLSGNFINSTVDFLRSINREASIKFFEENVDVIKALQRNNVPMATEFDVNAIVNRPGVKGWLKNEFGDTAGEVWASTLENPTFKRFFPMLQINTYKSVYKSAINSGMEPEAAEKVAAQAVKNYYGIVGSDELAKRSQLGQDVVSTIFFAPKYRESLINFWVNTVKAVKDPLALENRKNLTFLVGAGLAYAGMDALNRQFNGHSMSENPPGKEMMLMIPAGETTLGVPWLSSIGFLPRSIIQTVMAGVKGDFEEVGNQLKGHTSMLLRGGLDIASNENYWGEQIYDPNSDTSEKYKAVALYLGEQYNHPYLRPLVAELREKGSGTDLKTIVKTLEIPVRVYSTKSQGASWYYAMEKEGLKNLSKEEQAVYEKLHRSKLVDEDGLPIYSQRSAMADAMDRLVNPNVFIIEMEIAKKTAEKNGTPLNPLYELSPDQQRVVLILKTLPPGSEEKLNITNQNREWLKPYWEARAAYTEYLKAEGIIADTQLEGKPIVTEELQAKIDFYYTIPSGTGGRTAFLAKYPEVKTFFEENRAYTNQQRIALGLPPLEEFKSYGSGGSKKAPTIKKTAMPSFSAPKIESMTINAPKLMKMKTSSLPLPKFNEPKKQKSKYSGERMSPQIKFRGATTLSQLGK